MTFQSSLPELEILPDGIPYNNQPLFSQLSNRKLQTEKGMDRSPMRMNTPQAVESYIPRRRLFQQRATPQKDFPEEEDQMNISIGSLDLVPDDEPIVHMKKPQRKQRLIEEDILPSQDVDWTEREEHTVKQLQDNVLKKSNKQSTSVPHNTKLKGYVVYKDFDCMLNLTDITYGVKGNNKFYQMQILHKDNQQFTNFTQWGRIGAPNPRSDFVEVESRIDAIKHFKKTFAHKTEQQWDDRDKFQQQPGKYNLMGGRQGGGSSNNTVNDDVDRLNKRNAILAQKIKHNESKLQPDLKDLMASIYDINQMQRTLKELNIDTEKNPLGRLSSDQITMGYKVLKEIQTQLKLPKCRADVLAQLSNQFYTNIPQNYGYKKLPVIDTPTRLREKVQLLDILRELDVANKYMNIATNEQNKDINPLDLFYELLKCHIQPLEDMEMFETIRNAVKSTHGPTHDKHQLQVVGIFDVDRTEEKFRYFPFNGLPNKKLLWHGSRTSNYVGILSEGLKIAPPDAPSSGYMFGKGIYFSDVCSKSAQYCQHSIEHPDGLILLCEVALGSMYRVFESKTLSQAPHHYHSVHGVGRHLCDPQRQIKLQNDVSFDVGSILINEDLKVQNIKSELTYNEYIVYDVAQVKIKYIVKIRFLPSQF